MNKQMLAVMQRRGDLLAKIASQREQIAAIGMRWQTPLALADHAVRFLHSNPVLVAALAALIVVRRRGMAGLAGGAWRMWKGYRYLTALSARLASRRKDVL